MKGNPLLLSVQVTLEKGGQEEAIGFIDKVHRFISSGKYGEVLDGLGPVSLRPNLNCILSYGKRIPSSAEQDDRWGISKVYLMWYNCDNDDDLVLCLSAGRSDKPRRGLPSLWHFYMPRITQHLRRSHMGIISSRNQTFYAEEAY